MWIQSRSTKTTLSQTNQKLFNALKKYINPHVLKKKKNSRAKKNTPKIVFQNHTPCQEPSASRFHCAHCAPPAFSPSPAHPRCLRGLHMRNSNVHSVLAYEYAWMHGCTRKLGMKICGKFSGHMKYSTFSPFNMLFFFHPPFWHLRHVLFGEDIWMHGNMSP